MNKWYVLYTDGAWEMGGIGWDKFDTEQKALDYINKRMKQVGVEANIKNYNLIEGTSRELQAVEVATRVKVKK